MTLLQSLLHLTNFKTPFLQTLVPSVSAAFAIQTAFAIPSVFAESEKFYDVSGALTYLTVTALSLYLPAIRARHAAGLASNISIPSLLSAFRGSPCSFNWRQVALSGAVAFWATRLGSYLFQRILAEGADSRFEKIKKSKPAFLVAWFGQATWVSLCMMPVIAINSVPAATFAAVPGLRLTDMLGLSLYAGGFLFEIIADLQKSKWLEEKKAKVHDEEFLTRGLWSRCRHPNYFGESTLWTGIATVAAGVLVTRPVGVALGLNPATAVMLSYISPAFVTLLLLKVSGVPPSERKYDKRYGDRKEYQEWKKNTPMFFPKIL